MIMCHFGDRYVDNLQQSAIYIFFLNTSSYLNFTRFSLFIFIFLYMLKSE